MKFPDDNGLKFEYNDVDLFFPSYVCKFSNLMCFENNTLIEIHFYTEKMCWVSLNIYVLLKKENSLHVPFIYFSQ